VPSVRASRSVAVITAFSLTSLSAAQAGDAVAKDYRKLSGREIRTSFTGKVFSDGTHFSSRYEANGKIEGFTMGKKVSNRWKILDGNLCITDSLGELCYAVWKKGRDVELIEKGSDITIDGSLR